MSQYTTSCCVFLTYPSSKGNALIIYFPIVAFCPFYFTLAFLDTFRGPCYTCFGHVVGVKGVCKMVHGIL